MTDLKIPSAGESVTGGTLAAWLKSDGEHVNAGDEVLELETDKATLAVPSPASGVLKITVKEGEDVLTGQVVGRIDTDVKEDSIPDSSAVPERPVPETAEEKVPVPDHYSPSVRHTLQIYGLRSLEGPGSGKNGHVTREDVLDYVRKKGLKPVNRREDSPSHPSGESQPVQEITRVKMSRIRQKIAANLVESRQQSAHLTTFNEVDMSSVMDMRKLYQEDFLKAKGVKLGFMSFFVKAVCLALRE